MTTPAIFQGDIKVIASLSNPALYGLGQIEVAVGPTTNFQVATKKYVDDLIAGLDWKESCNYKTVGPLSTAATPAGAQAGKTITNAGALVQLTIDGVLQTTVGTRILVDQTGTAGVVGLTNTSNGIYTVTNVGSGVTAWVLTRAADADGVPQGEVDQGMTTLVTGGVTAAGTTWTLTTPDPVIVDTSPQIFVQSGAGAVPAWSNVLAVGNTTGGTSPVLSSGDVFRGVDAAVAPGSMQIRGGNVTAGPGLGGSLTLTGGSAALGGSGGIVQIAGGAGTTSGGAIQLTGGTGTIGGGISVTTGASTSGQSGDLTLATGATTTGLSGTVRINTANGATTSGSLQLQTGTASGVGNNSGGISLLVGNAGSSAVANDITVTGGSSATTASSITMMAGNSNVTGNAGSITIMAGLGGFVSGNAGSINITAGGTGGSGTAGDVNIRAGVAPSGIGTINLYSRTNMPSGQANNTQNHLKVTGTLGTPTGNPGGKGQIGINEATNTFYGHIGGGVWSAFSTSFPTLAQVLAAGNDTNGVSIINSLGAVTVGDNFSVTGVIQYSVERITAAGGGPNVSPSGNVDTVFITTTLGSGAAATGILANGAIDGRIIRLVCSNYVVDYELSVTAGYSASGAVISKLVFQSRGQSAVLVWDATLNAWLIIGGSGVGVL